MKNIGSLIISIFLIILSAAAVFAQAEKPDIYCPLQVSQHWTYSLYSKKENRQRDDFDCYVNRTETIGGVEYFDYEIPSKNMHFYAWKDDNGAYLKAAKISLPVLGFLSVDIEFDPPVCLLKFPVIKGDSWSYKGTAHAKVLGLINIDQKASGDFTQIGPEIIEVNGRTLSAFHMRGVSSRKWDVEKPIIGDCWIGKDIGVLKGETPNSRMELKAYEVK